MAKVDVVVDDPVVDDPVVVVEVITDLPYSDSLAEEEEDIPTEETILAAVRRRGRGLQDLMREVRERRIVMMRGRKVGRTEITHQETGSLMMMMMSG